MNSSQFWAALRHAATAVGGALVSIPDWRFQAAGSLLLAAGTGSSLYLKRDKNPGLPLPPAVFVIACALGGAVIGGTFAGCANKPGDGWTVPGLSERDAYSVGKFGAIGVLTKDPSAEAELLRVCAGIDTVFTTGELTPMQLKRFLDSAKVKPQSQLLIAAFATGAYDRFITGQGKSALLTSDPAVAAALKEFQHGIRDGIEFSKVFVPLERGSTKVSGSVFRVPSSQAKARKAITL